MHRLRIAAVAAMILGGGLLYGFPGSAQQTHPALPHVARAGLLDAARDDALPVWQREFMVDVADSGASVSQRPAPDFATSADGVWLQLPPPSARDLHVAVYDPVRDRMVVFGGYSTQNLVNDVWVLSLAGTPEWSRLNPAGTPPSPRHLMSAIYDPVRDRMVVFGGLDHEGYRDDVWALSLDTTPTWTRILPTGGAPPGRALHSAVYDPVRDRMIVFGGLHGVLPNANAGPLNDAWALSLSDPPEWTLLSPVGPPPSARSHHSAVYDPHRNRVLVFGGFDGQLRLNDAWSLTLTGRPRWRPLDPSGPLPTPRVSHSAIYDPVGDRMVIFSGLADGYVNDTWALSLNGRGMWSRIDVQSQPSVRWGHSAIYDPVRARMVVFGGLADGYRLASEIWGLSLSAAPAWTNLTTPNTPPVVRRGHSAVFDAVHQRMILFGGYNDQLNLLNDVWMLSLAGNPVWTQLHPSGTGPSPREGHAAIYDPIRDRMIVFGGDPGRGTFSNEVWALSLSGEPAWTKLAPAGAAPEARTDHTAIYDASNDRMVVFGGVGHWYLGDVWALSLAAQPAWTRLVPTGTLPRGRFEHSAIYDPLRERMLVFGGNYNLSILDDVWSLSLGTMPAWTQITPTGTKPSARAAHQAIYDAARDRMVVFGGYNYSPGAFPGAGTWALSLASNEWTLLAPAGTRPASRSLHSQVYDPVADRMLVFGGDCGSNDLWELRWGSPAAAPRAFAPPMASIAASDLAVPRIFPNPSRADVTISFRLARPGEASVRISDVAGRNVRMLVSGTLPAGPGTITWDRRTSAGVLAQPGLYFCEIRASAQTSVQRIVLVR